MAIISITAVAPTDGIFLYWNLLTEGIFLYWNLLTDGILRTGTSLLTEYVVLEYLH
jgi:hypothetical protein